MTLSQAVVPEYGGANLASLVPALMEAPEDRPEWLPAALRSAGQIVLFVVDGLGWLQMQDRMHLTPNLATMVGAPITSVAPSTTACALTSLVVGAPPTVHGVVGYRVLVTGPTGPEVMNVLKWKTVSGDARPFVNPGTFQVVAPFGGHPVPVVSKADFAGTAFSEAHQRGSIQVGWIQASGLAVEVLRLVVGGQPLVYAYYDGIDRIAHIKGFGDFYDAELIAVDRLVGDLLDGLPPTAVLAVTADHGQVDVGRRAVEIAPEIMAQVSILSGEPRFRWLHAADPSSEGVARLVELTTKLYGHEAWVASVEQVEELGWLGGILPPEFRSRVGHVALVPFEPVAYLDPAEGESKLVCRHGSLTEAEMLIPLVAASGRLGT